MSLNVLLISDEMIKERSALHGNTDAKMIRGDIKTAQDMYVMPLLGTALYKKLQTLITGGTITDAANVNYKTLLDDYLIDTLMFYTLYDLSTTLSFQLWNKGMVRKLGENTELPTMSEIYDIANKYKTKAEHYATRARNYLRANANAMYPEYLNPGSAIDTVNPEHRAFTSPIYLGGDDCGCNNEMGFNGQPYSG